jgi:hypothetical protein
MYLLNHVSAETLPTGRVILHLQSYWLSDSNKNFDIKIKCAQRMFWITIIWYTQN